MREEELKSQGLDIVFALDLSASMATEDVVPSRLKKAKHIIRTFLENLSGDRVGVLAFARSAIPVVPLTNDYDYVRQIVETLDERTIGYQGSDINNAVSNAFRMIERGSLSLGYESKDMSAEQLSKALIILSDGEDHESSQLPESAKAKELGIRVYAIGLGTEAGAPIPVRDERGFLKGYKKDQSGAVVLSKLNSKFLQKISQYGSGKYFTASVSEDEVRAILDELQSFERDSGGSRKVTIYNEIYQYPLFIAVILVFLSINSLEVKKRKTALSSLLLIFSTLTAQAGLKEERANSYSEFSHADRAIKARDAGDLSAAVRHFAKAQAENPESARNHFNLGSTLLETGAAKEAIANLELAQKSQDPMLSGISSYNLGRALQKESAPEKAMDAFQNGLQKVDQMKRLGQYGAEEKELEKKLRQALMAAEQQSQKQKSQDKDKKDNQGQGKGQDDKDKKSDEDSSGQDKDKDDKGKEENKKYDIPKEKKKYKAENLTENDAKRLMQQLKEQETETTKKLNRKKSLEQKDKNKEQNEAGGKDW
jgi:Ca-activated chloride channel family protein